MIQRMQSVWLLLAAACAFATFKLSFYSGTKNLAYYELNGRENFLITATTTVIGVLALITIFLFKTRTVQLRLCVLGILLEALLIFLYYREVTTFAPGPGTYSLWAILHSVIVICFFLAARGINKDEKLIKDSDRLR